MLPSKPDLSLSPADTVKWIRGGIDIQEHIEDPETRDAVRLERESIMKAIVAAMTLNIDPTTVDGLTGLASLLSRALTQSHPTRTRLQALILAVEATGHDSDIQALHAAVVEVTSFAVGEPALRAEVNARAKRIRDETGVTEIERRVERMFLPKPNDA